MAAKRVHSRGALAERYLRACLKAGHLLSYGETHAALDISNTTLERYFGTMEMLRDIAEKIYQKEHGAKLDLPTRRQQAKSSRLKEEPVVFYDFRQAKDKMNEILRFVKSEEKIKDRPKADEKHTGYGVVACLHIPLHARKNLVRAVEWLKRKGASRLVVAGDLIDCLSLGHAGYRRNIRPQHYVSLKEELAEAKVVLAYLAGEFQEITVMPGNHPERVRKYFTERVGPELMFLVQHDVVSLLAADFPNIEVAKNERGGNEIHWLHQVGDVTITHAEVGSSIELRPTVRVDQWFKEWNDYLRFSPYTVLIEAHTHQAGQIPLNDGAKMLVEAGCLCVSAHCNIETQTGRKRASSIRVGDFVLTHKNRFRRVEKVFAHQHRGDVIAVHYGMSGSRKVRLVTSMTSEHPVLAYRGGHKCWVKAEDLKATDWVFTQSGKCVVCNLPIPFYRKFCGSGKCNASLQGRAEGGKGPCRQNGGGSPTLMKHLREDILPVARQLTAEGFRVVPIGNIIPDCIAIRDNKVFAIEVESNLRRTRPYYEKYDIGNYRQYFDDVIWIVKDNPYKPADAQWWFDEKTGFIAVPIRKIARRDVGGKRYKALPVYNFQVQEDNSYVAGKLVVHNCLEPQYAIEPTIKYRHPQVNAATYFSMSGDAVDYNSISQRVFRGME